MVPDFFHLAQRNNCRLPVPYSSGTLLSQPRSQNTSSGASAFGARHFLALVADFPCGVLLVAVMRIQLENKFNRKSNVGYDPNSGSKQMSEIDYNLPSEPPPRHVFRHFIELT
jgi:hypothetical protein